MNFNLTDNHLFIAISRCLLSRSGKNKLGFYTISTLGTDYLLLTLKYCQQGLKDSSTSRYSVHDIKLYYNLYMVLKGLISDVFCLFHPYFQCPVNWQDLKSFTAKKVFSVLNKKFHKIVFNSLGAYMKSQLEDEL